MSGSGAINVVAAAVAVLVVVLALRWTVRREPDRVIRRLILAGFVAKVAGTVAYYRVIDDVYGFGDVTRYVNVGRELAPIIRSGTLPDQASESGTQFTEFLAGTVFAIFGPNEFFGYLVFALLSFAGMVAFLRALQLAVPTANHRWYAALVLLLPTMVYWPSTIGKDAWLVCWLGFGSLGVAWILTRARFGYALTLVSVLGMAAVRPHMAALFSVSFAAAYLVRMADKDVAHSAASWLIGLVLVGGVVTYATTTFSEEMGSGEVVSGSRVEQLRADTDQVLDQNERNTRIGGSQFDNQRVRSPSDLLQAMVTVPFRPFPHEAENLQAQLASLEGVFLLALLVVSIPQLLRLPRLALRKPYVAFATVYTVGFVFAFSTFANFGLLARQRSQLVPFLVVLLVLHARERKQEPSLVDVDEHPPGTHLLVVAPEPQAPDPALAEPAEQPALGEELEVVIYLDPPGSTHAPSTDRMQAPTQTGPTPAT
jgi:hypothetical protein